MSQSLYGQSVFCLVPTKGSTSYCNTHPDFFLVWEVADGMCVSPMTDALNSDKAVLVQSGLSLAQANPQKKKGDPLV